jgi:predicted Zn finger-like uncharacterized protein
VIITCEQCRTQFQLDDSRIPEGGVRVRCSRCKHAFVVKPATEAGDPVDHAVEQALPEDEEQLAGSIQELGPAAAPRSGAEEESDWEFNDGSPDPEPDLTAAREVVDDLLGSVDAAPSEAADDGLLDADSDVDVDEDIDSLLDSTACSADLVAPEPAAPAGPEPAAPAGPEPAAPAEPELVAPAEPELAAPAEPEPAAPLVAGEPTAPPPAQPAAPPPAQPADRAAGEELGSPESWDFFSEEQEGSLSEGAGFEQTPVGRIGLVPQPTLERPPIDVDAEPSMRGPRLRRLAHAAGWLGVALLVLGGLHGGIVAQRAGPLPMRTAQTASGLEATGVEGHWLDNAAAGPIYVISGELRRAGSRPAAPGAWLAVRLFDESGVLLAEEAAAAGPALPEARLREEDPRQLRAAQAQDALAMARAPLMAGEAWPFQAILTHLPEAASRFDLAAIPLEVPPPAPEAP